jgi:asparagine synthase (glutamine-hydrolysing)
MLNESDKRRLWKGSKVRATEEWIDDQLPAGASSLDVQMRGDIEIHLLSVLLVKMDIATLAASLEGRSPFLDHEVAEFALRIPESELLHGGATKSLLRDAYRQSLPTEVTAGSKRGFEIPLRDWLTGGLRTLLMDTVGARTARIRSYLDGSFIDELLAEGVMQDRNWAFIVYSLLVLELWLQEYESGSRL